MLTYIKKVLFGPPVWDINTLKPLDPPKEYPVDYSPSPLMKKLDYYQELFDKAIYELDNPIDKESGLRKAGFGFFGAMVCITFNIVFFGLLISLLALTL